MQTFERQYAELLEMILLQGTKRETRNGETTSMFALNLKVPVGPTFFPILEGRKMFHKGVFGEFAAMIRKPKSLADFEKWGCNYWKLWAKEDGSINVDYGNAWFADGQMDHLLHCLEHNPTDRRMIINGWRPDRLGELDLPCCHYSYQFYVEGDKLHMIWNQRSVDMMIGLPSDIVFAAVWLITLANQFGYEPGFISMNLGDCHIYAEHYEATGEYVSRVRESAATCGPTYSLRMYEGESFETFEPDFLQLHGYNPLPAIKLELKA